MLPSVYRPVKGKLLVRLPYMSGGGNYALLHDFCGDRITVTFNHTKHAFEVATPHLQEIIDGCLDHFGELELTTEHYAQQTCVEKCWMANLQHCLELRLRLRRPQPWDEDAFDRLILDGTVSVQGEYLIRSLHLAL